MSDPMHATTRRPQEGLFLPEGWQDRPWRGDGLFGPDSFTWAMHSSPAVLLGAARAALIQLLYPPVAAAIADHSDYLGDLHGRTARTLEFGYATTYGDAEIVQRAREVFGRVHARITGTEPLTGRTYSAMDLEHRRFVAVSTAHSMVIAYQAIGGRMTPPQINTYFAEYARAAHTSHLSVQDLPTTRAEVREYFHRMRPRLALTDTSRPLIAGLMDPPAGDVGALKPLGVAVAAYGAALMPRHLQRIAGLDHHPLLERYVIKPAGSTAFRAMAVAPIEAWLPQVCPSGAKLRRWAMRHAESNDGRRLAAVA